MIVPMGAVLTWREVLSDWCPGPRRTAPTDVPGTLGEFWVAGGARALSLQNRFQLPADADGYSVFYVENQHVCEWAYRSADVSDDPAVYVREPPASWVAVGCRLDAFLTAAAVIEIGLGARFGRSAEGPARELDDVLGLDRVQLPELGWPPGVSTSYYKGPDLLAFAQDIGGGHAYVYIGSRHPAALREIDDRINASPHCELI